MKIVWTLMLISTALLSSCASAPAADGCGSKNILQREAGGSRPVHHDLAL